MPTRNNTSHLTRREMLRAMGLISAGGLVTGNAIGEIPLVEKADQPAPLRPFTGKSLTAITLGAGNRGNVYGNYALAHPEQIRIVGVAEPIPYRNQRYVDKHGIAAENRFVTWEHVFERPKFADVIIITTPDNLHYGPAMKALEMGYHLLLEKPIAQSWQECRDILDQARRYDRIVAVCHVLRYAPYYRKIKEVLASGTLGTITSVSHFEPIQHQHMAHSYVRGIWRREDLGVPILLAKSCHDLDILRWWLDRSCRHITSFGSLSWFKEENAPAGSTARCTDGCAVEESCPYSALRIYLRKHRHLGHLDVPSDPATRDAVILQRLKEGQYGRCVYRCDNTVNDHQVVSMEFEGGVTANFNMEAFTSYAGRRTRIMGTMGDIVGDEDVLYIADFRTEAITKWVTKEHAEGLSGHGGGDWGLMRDFVEAASREDKSLLTSTLEASMESHLMGFLAEKSRRDRTVEAVRL